MELEVAYEFGMFHSEFLAASADDRDKALWTHSRRRNACPRCGTRKDEWDEALGGHRHAYRGEIHRCQGCVVLERTQDAPQLQGEGRQRGLHAVLVRNDRDLLG